MKKVKTYEGFFKDMMRPYIPSDFHEDIYGREGKHNVTVVSKREKKKTLGDDKFLVGIEFADGFTQEVEVDYPTYSRLKIGQKTIFNL